MQSRKILPLIAWLLLSLASSLNSSALASTSEYDPKLARVLQQTAAESVSFSDRFEAEVWLSDMSNRLSRLVDDQGERLTLLKNIHKEATHAGLPPELVLAVIEVESRFDRFALSNAGAQGLMQVMPFWLKEIGRPEDNLFNVETNLRMGCTILKYYMDMENGDLMRALGRYNGSLGKQKYPLKVIDKLNRYWFRV